MVCILVYLNYFYCEDIPFIVKRKENIGIFTLSLQYSNFEIPIKMEIDLTTPALLFSAISLIMLAYTNRFLSYAQLVRTLKDQYGSPDKPGGLSIQLCKSEKKEFYIRYSS